MSITVNLRYTGKDGSALAFAHEIMENCTVAKIRTEEGNLRYEYYQSHDDSETVLLIDSWRDQQSINKYVPRFADDADHRGASGEI